MLVRAKETCFVNGHRRRTGAEFDYEGGSLPSFLEAIGVEKDESVEEKAPRKRAPRHEAAPSSEEEVI